MTIKEYNELEIELVDELEFEWFKEPIGIIKKYSYKSIMFAETGLFLFGYVDQILHKLTIKDAYRLKERGWFISDFYGEDCLLFAKKL